jgi:hypothetical protein
VTTENGSPVVITTVIEETLSSTIITVEVVTGTGTSPPSLNDINGSKSNSGFFSNTGAVAGVFVVVGLAAAAIVLGLLFYRFRQRRRANMESDLRMAAGGAGDGGAGTTRFGDDDDEEEFLGGTSRMMMPQNGDQMTQVHDSNLYRSLSRQDNLGHQRTLSAESMYPLNISGPVPIPIGYQDQRESSVMDNSAYSDYGTGAANLARGMPGGGTYQGSYYDPNAYGYPGQSSGGPIFYDPNRFSEAQYREDDYSPQSSGEADYYDDKQYDGDHPMDLNDSRASMIDESMMDETAAHKVLR